MVKICKYIYVHFTTILLVTACWFNRQLEVAAVSYAVIFLHETAHLLAAAAIGLRPSHIIFFPFGVNLKLKNNIVFSLSEEIILYAAGPLSNIIMALAALPFHNRNELWRLFYLNNIVLFAFNMLPIVPMDGGIIMKKILSYILGSRNAAKIMTVCSVFLITALVFAETYITLHYRFNFNIFFVMIFLTGNIFTVREKYHVDFVKELMNYKCKDDFKFKRVKTYLLKDAESSRRLAECFAQGRHYVIFCENKDGKICEICTEREIIERLLERRGRR